MAHFKPPFTKVKRNLLKDYSVFLAGTIDIGNSINWQDEVAKELDEKIIFDGRKIDIYNPRRDDWDSSWTQEITNPQFYSQVNWELNELEKSNAVILNLLPNSKSPISLLELGHIVHIGGSSLYICCPKEFYRSGNIDIFCDRLNIKVYRDMDSLIKDFIEKHKIKV